MTKSDFLNLLLDLNKKGTIAVSVGETQYLIEAAKEFENLGFELMWVELNKDGSIKEESLKPCDYIFISSYIMDTFLKVDLEYIKNITNASIISNGTFDSNSISEIVYKTDKEIENKTFYSEKKEYFINCLKNELKDNIYFFVDNSETLPFFVHFALKNIKAREIMNTLKFEDIDVINGERCQLGLFRPSRIIEAMGFDEEICRNALIFCFDKNYTNEEIEKIAKKIAKKHRQIKVLNQGN